MRIVHTSDWHLGQTLHSMPRDHEHEAFLAWLLDTLESCRADALLISGDVFETANPPARAQELWYGFIAGARRRLPGLDLVVIGGNHDSAARLDAAGPVLRELGVRVVGSLRRDGSGGVDAGAHLAPLRDAGGEVAAWVAAVPFLRAADLPPGSGGGDPLVEGVRAVYRDVLEAARARREPGQALVAMGHCYLAGTALSELSERKILGGNQHALPPDLFPDDVAYVAVGHLHLAQAVGRGGRVRYSGSPLPLSLAEAPYPHQVVLVELDGERLAGVRPLAVPRAVEIVRVPERGAAPPAEALERLRGLPPLETAPEDPFRPYLEVRLLLERPEPGIRREVEEALEGRAPRLLKLTVEYPGDGRSLGEAAPGRSLEELTPEQVFRARYARDFEGDPPPELLEAFHELLEAARRGEGPA